MSPVPANTVGDAPYNDGRPHGIIICSAVRAHNVRRWWVCFVCLTMSSVFFVFTHPFYMFILDRAAKRVETKQLARLLLAQPPPPPPLWYFFESESEAVPDSDGGGLLHEADGAACGHGPGHGPAVPKVPSVSGELGHRLVISVVMERFLSPGCYGAILIYTRAPTNECQCSHLRSQRI